MTNLSRIKGHHQLPRDRSLGGRRGVWKTLGAARLSGSLLAAAAGAGPARAGDVGDFEEREALDEASGRRICGSTARLAKRACGHEVLDDYRITL